MGNEEGSGLPPEFVKTKFGQRMVCPNCGKPIPEEEDIDKILEEGLLSPWCNCSVNSDHEDK
jgi:hypothetical protein